jgi:single-stranded-DNA-specific exonuclease
MKAVSFRHWQVRQSELSPSAIERLAGELQLAPLTARVLAQRGLGSAEAGRGFLRSSLASLPDPFLLPGMDRAVARLAAAVEAGERIAVHGDYDVDGITGTALLVETLRLLGAEVESHIPLRLKDGYGLSAEALQKAAAGGARVALSVDCGVSAVAEAQLARELGLDLIITDHHQPPDPLPAALAIVNPHLPGKTVFLSRSWPESASLFFCWWGCARPCASEASLPPGRSPTCAAASIWSPWAP